jgi:pantoate--beta-alanine ligase
MSSVVVETVAALRERLAAERTSKSIGFVPTMGALHQGHELLIRRARSECDVVVVSIFVNPLQFDRADDLRLYPRTLEHDVPLCERLQVDIVFVPPVEEMYPEEPRCTVHVARLADYLCGRHRPGHFHGVATVVLKLFDIVQPDRAYFGEKDAQQLAIVRRLVRDFNIPLEIVGVQTVREADGLAISSRNRHLTPDERRLAPALHDALVEAASQIASGIRDPIAVKRAAAGKIPSNPAVRLEYLEIVDPDEMQPVESVSGPVCIAGAMWVGGTRLIDNVRWPT